MSVANGIRSRRDNDGGAASSTSVWTSEHSSSRGPPHRHFDKKRAGADERSRTGSSSSASNNNNRNAQLHHRHEQSAYGASFRGSSAGSGNNNSSKNNAASGPSGQPQRQQHQHQHERHLLLQQQQQQQQQQQHYDSGHDGEDATAGASESPRMKRNKPVKWSAEEDRRLRDAVGKFSEARWKDIANLVETRNHVQCLQRWKKVLKPGLVKGQWSADEDNRLVSLVERGFRNWGQVASFMDGRTSKQCRERWCHHLDPAVRKGGYTTEEDDLIIFLQGEVGNRWADIAKRLTGRTENAVKIRWKALNRRQRDARNKAAAAVALGASDDLVSESGTDGGRAHTRPAFRGSPSPSPSSTSSRGSGRVKPGGSGPPPITAAAAGGVAAPGVNIQPQHGNPPAFFPISFQSTNSPGLTRPPPPGDGDPRSGGTHVAEAGGPEGEGRGRWLPHGSSAQDAAVNDDRKSGPVEMASSRMSGASHVAAPAPAAVLRATTEIVGTVNSRSPSNPPFPPASKPRPASDGEERGLHRLVAALRNVEAMDNLHASEEGTTGGAPSSAATAERFRSPAVGDVHGDDSRRSPQMSSRSSDAEATTTRGAPPVAASKSKHDADNFARPDKASSHSADAISFGSSSVRPVHSSALVTTRHPAILNDAGRIGGAIGSKMSLRRTDVGLLSKARSPTMPSCSDDARIDRARASLDKTPPPSPPPPLFASSSTWAQRPRSAEHGQKVLFKEEAEAAVGDVLSRDTLPPRCFPAGARALQAPAAAAGPSRISSACSPFVNASNLSAGRGNAIGLGGSGESFAMVAEGSAARDGVAPDRKRTRADDRGMPVSSVPPPAAGGRAGASLSDLSALPPRKRTRSPPARSPSLRSSPSPTAAA